MISNIDSPFRTVSLLSKDSNITNVSMNLKVVNGVLCGSFGASSSTAWTVGAWNTIGVLDVGAPAGTSLQAEAFSGASVNRVGVMAISPNGEVRVYAKTANETSAIAVFSHPIS